MPILILFKFIYKNEVSSDFFQVELYILIIKSCWPHIFSWLTLVICPYSYQQSLFLSSLDGTHCSQIADECKCSLIGLLWCVHEGEIMEEWYLWTCSCFSSKAQHVLIILFGWFIRWEVSGCTAVVLRGVTSRICSTQHAASLYSSHQAFSPSISFD